MRLESLTHVVPEGGNLMLSPGTTFAHQTLLEERGQLVCGTLPQDPTEPQLLKTKAPWDADDAPGEVSVCRGFSRMGEQPPL